MGYVADWNEPEADLRCSEHGGLLLWRKVRACAAQSAGGRSMNSRKDSDIQLAQNELEYWKAKELSISAAIKRLEDDRKIAENSIRTWTRRIEKLVGQ